MSLLAESTTFSTSDPKCSLLLTEGEGGDVKAHSIMIMHLGVGGRGINDHLTTLILAWNWEIVLQGCFEYFKEVHFVFQK